MDLNSQSSNRPDLASLNKYSSYLRVLAEMHLGKWLQSRMGASDIVQDTLLDATRGYDQFQGTTDAERLAWLKSILLNNINRVVDVHISAQKRSVKREVSLSRLQNLHHSSLAIEEALAAQISTPSESAERHELLLAVTDCLTELSDDHRQAILLRTMQSKSFAEVGKIMDRSESAMRMLWLRAVEELRKGLARRNLV